MEEKKEKMLIPDGIIQAIALELAIGLISHDKLAKKYKVSPDTVTKISRLEQERIGYIKKEIRQQVESATTTWAKQLSDDMQELTKDLLKEAGLKKKRENASLPQLVIALATLIDKTQLLTGGATSRNEVVKMTSKEDLINALTNKNTNYIEKSIKNESANNNLELNNNKNNFENIKENIKKILKNQSDLLN